MKRRANTNKDVKAQAWARRLALRVQQIIEELPDADPDNVRHTLILLELPLERLRRSLIRGRATAILRK